MTKAERLQWWLDYPNANSAVKSLPSVDCSPLGIVSLLGVTALSTISTWSSARNHESDVSTDSGPTREEDNDSSPDTESRKEHCPWDDWHAFVQELDSSNVHSCTVCSPSTSAVP